MKRTTLLAGGTAAAVVATGATFAFASTPTHTGAITGCYSTHTGTLRVVKSVSDCRHGEHVIRWNKAGTAGHVVRHYAGLPKSSLGNNGDFFVDTAHHVFYGPKIDGRWPAHGTSLVGATGATGATGDDGAPGPTGTAGAPGAAGTSGTNGTDGAAVRHGVGAPGNSVGNDGDFYLDTSAMKLYGPKHNGAWGFGTPLTGPQGGSGAQGAAGTNGTDGQIGPAGPNGYPGYQVVTASQSYSYTNGSAMSVSAQASCPAGEILMGGGAYKTQDTGEITANGPSTSNPQTWVARVGIRSDENNASDTLYAVAFCANPSN